MGMDQYIHLTGFDRFTNQWQVLDWQEDLYFRKFYALHDWIVKNCTAQTGTADSFGFDGKHFIATEDNCVLFPMKRTKWMELKKVLGKIINKYNSLSEDLQVLLDTDIHSNNPRLQEFVNLVSATFPDNIRGGIPDISEIHRMYDFIKIVCGGSYGRNGFIAGDKKPTKALMKKINSRIEEYNIKKAEYNKFIANYLVQHNCPTFAELYVKDKQKAYEFEDISDKWCSVNNFNTDYREWLNEAVKEENADGCRYAAYAYAYYAWY